MYLQDPMEVCISNFKLHEEEQVTTRKGSGYLVKHQAIQMAPGMGHPEPQKLNGPLLGPWTILNKPNSDERNSRDSLGFLQATNRVQLGPSCPSFQHVDDF